MDVLGRVAAGPAVAGFFAGVIIEREPAIVLETPALHPNKTDSVHVGRIQMSDGSFLRIILAVQGAWFVTLACGLAYVLVSLMRA